MNMELVAMNGTLPLISGFATLLFTKYKSITTISNSYHFLF
jgi:hypothetical protein